MFREASMKREEGAAMPTPALNRSGSSKLMVGGDACEGECLCWGVPAPEFEP